MKTGIRKPNIKKSVKARTTGKVKRAVKSSVNPMYGKKGTGVITDPKKAAYNAVYNRTTVDARPDLEGKSESVDANTLGCAVLAFIVALAAAIIVGVITHKVLMPVILFAVLFIVLLVVFIVAVTFQQNK